MGKLDTEEFQQFNALKEAASALLEAMETCHHCKGSVLVEEGPTHCENCSYDCADHEPPSCVGIDVLHAQLKRAL
jgi:hypothetical protein